MKNKLVFEEINKPLKLYDISPKWAARLERGQQLPTVLSLTWLRWYFELKRASRCVVGEAHSYSSSYMYYCRECDEIGWRFMLYFTLRSYAKLEENKHIFVKHWNSEHT
ncbi:MAG: hypothetical protein WAK17_08710 [Candidatus Nitrosopolaris sp.]|jgi:hypothetical protein